MDLLFAPGTIKGLTIKNRIVFPPVVCFTFSEENGFVSEKNINHYKAIADSGTGLIIVEATCVSKEGRLSDNQLGIWSDDYIEGLSKIAKVCHEKGAKVFIQIHHAGLRAHPKVTDDRISSSDYIQGDVSAREMTVDEILKLEQDFVEAAIRAEKAGFDGVELHGAHGYLMTQFFSEDVNKRTDPYGGNLVNRLRFTEEVFKGIRKKVHENFIVGIRMGCNEGNLQNSIAMALHFEAIGMDFLHISTGFSGNPILEQPPEGFPGNWIVYGAAKIREQVNIPVIAVNGIKTSEIAHDLVDNQWVDYVAIGRAQLADYQFVKHIRECSEFLSCLDCKPCKWFKNGDLCPRRK